MFLSWYFQIHSIVWIKDTTTEYIFWNVTIKINTRRNRKVFRRSGTICMPSSASHRFIFIYKLINRCQSPGRWPIAPSRAKVFRWHEVKKNILNQLPDLLLGKWWNCFVLRIFCRQNLSHIYKSILRSLINYCYHIWLKYLKDMHNK